MGQCFQKTHPLPSLLTLSILFTVCCSISRAEETLRADPAKQSSKANAAQDPFDFEKTESSQSKDQEYIETDDSIKLVLEPLSHSAVVDRVLDASTTIKVRAPGAVKVDVFVEAVDSPYCGKPLSEPRLIGSARNSSGTFSVVWDSPESNRYVRVYALAYKANGTNSRSKSRDLAIGGLRFQAQK